MHVCNESPFIWNAFPVLLTLRNAERNFVWIAGALILDLNKVVKLEPVTGISACIKEKDLDDRIPSTSAV